VLIRPSQINGRGFPRHFRGVNSK